MIFLFLFTFIFYYPISFYVGIVSILILMYQLLKKKKSSRYLKLTVFLFIIEIAGILSFIKEKVIENSIYSCYALSKYNSDTIVLLDNLLNMRILLTEQIISCDIKDGKDILKDNIEKKDFYDSSKKYRYVSYFYVNAPIIEPLAGISYKQINHK